MKVDDSEYHLGKVVAKKPFRPQKQWQTKKQADRVEKHLQNCQLFVGISTFFFCEIQTLEGVAKGRGSSHQTKISNQVTREEEKIRSSWTFLRHLGRDMCHVFHHGTE